MCYNSLFHCLLCPTFWWLTLSLWEARCLPVETGMAPIKRGAHKPEICQWSRHPSSSRLIKIFPWWQHMARRWKSFTLWPWHPLTGLVCGLPLKNLLKYPWWPVKDKIPPVSIYLTKCWIEKLNLLLPNPNHFSWKWSRETILKFSSLPKKRSIISMCGLMLVTTKKCITIIIKLKKYSLKNIYKYKNTNIIVRHLQCSERRWGQCINVQIFTVSILQPHDIHHF